MPTGSGPPISSPTQQNNLNGTDRRTSVDNNASSNSSGHSNGSSKLPTVSHDHTQYVQRARVTRPAPPKPCANPMQFVQIKPCNLYQSAQEQLKRAEEVKKVKEVKKEDPEDWQNNLDNWKSSRRKRVEHIIDRVVEVKKLEEEEHDRMRRKSKTFSEMMEEKKCSRRATKLAAILYTEEESNDLSDLGIGTSSASGKSSLSEDYDNQSVMSDNVDNDKHSIDLDHASHHDGENGGTSRGYTSSPGYDTSSSTAPASSPDPCEYTYEGAIEDYKSRISKAQSGTYNNGFRNNLAAPAKGNYSKDSTPERSSDAAPSITNFHNIRRPSGTKIEDRLMSFEIKSASDLSDSALAAAKKDLPKVDILKRRELFEKETTTTVTTTSVKTSNVVLIKPAGGSNDFSPSKSIKERLSSLEKVKTPASIIQAAVVEETIKPSSAAVNHRLSGDITSIKDRLQTLEKQITPTAEKMPKIDVPVVSLKDRLSSLQSAVAKEETKKPVVLIDEYQLEMMKQEDGIMRQQQQHQQQQQQQLQQHMKDDAASHTDEENIHSSQEILSIQDESNVDTDREDSGIHTTDVSCSVSQTDEQPELLISEETHHHHHHINSNDGLCHDRHEKIEEIVEQDKTIVSDMIAGNTSVPSSSSNLDESIHLDATTATDDRSLSITTPEPAIDLDASVSLSLSESPTTSTNTVIFDGGSDLGVVDQEDSNSMVAVKNVETYDIVDKICSSQPRFSTNQSTNSSTALLTPTFSLSSNNCDVVTKKNEFTNIKVSLPINQVDIESSSPTRDENRKLSPQDRRKTIIETCEKRSVKSPEDVLHISTPYVNVDFKDIGEPEPVLKPKNSTIPVETPLTFDEVTPTAEVPKLSPVSNKSPSNCPNLPTEEVTPDSDMLTEENGVVVAELEVITTEIKVRPQSPHALIASSPTSPPINPKTHPLALKPKNIFDFIKKNFHGSSETTETPLVTSPTVNRRDTIAIDNSKFYVAVDAIDSSSIATSSLLSTTATPPSSPSSMLTGTPSKNEVNIQITKTTKTEKIVEKTDSVDSTNTMTSEINQLLDEELAKLTIEDTRL